MKEYRRGDIVYAYFNGKGSVQHGFRPCLIISNRQTNCSRSKILNVAPLTTKEKNIPVHVLIKPEDVSGYLEKTSYCMLEQTVPIDKQFVTEKMGHIKESSEVMDKVDLAIIKQFEIKKENVNHGV